MAELFLGGPIFSGKDECEQWRRIIDICGTPNLDEWPEAPSLSMFKEFVPKESLPNQLERNLVAGLQMRSHRSFPDGALQLILQLLQLCPDERITAKEALQSPYFNHFTSIE